MIEELLMPKLGMAQSYCVIEKWLKKPGDKVNKGDSIVEVSTDKVTYEVEAKSDGYLLKVTKQEGEEVPAQEIIAYIGQQGEELPGTVSENQKVTGPGNFIPGSANLQESAKKAIILSPLAKKIITDNSLDESMITGSGPGGRIMKEDVLEFMKNNPVPEIKSKKDSGNLPTGIKQPENMPQVDKVVKLEGIRKIIADKMVFSKQNIPHISQSINVDVTEMVKFKEKASQSQALKVTYSDFILKAVSLALKDNLELNSAFIDGQHFVYKDINPGLVVSLDNGLIIPVIKNCDLLTLKEIAIKRNELLMQARQGNISMADISGGTFTITNLGMLKIRSCTAIIYPPQAAILSVGGIFSSIEVMQDEKTAIRQIMDFTITEDHRVLDGVSGARFLSTLKKILEEPEKLVG